MTAEEWFIEGRSKPRSREETIAFLQRIMDDERKLGMQIAFQAVVDLQPAFNLQTRNNILREAREAIKAGWEKIK